jgi:hypothetical protein
LPRCHSTVQALKDLDAGCRSAAWGQMQVPGAGQRRLACIS